ncbi:hypothetical protein PspR76_16270 [Pseudomonas sp. R76]|nr:hypothetical protein PspR76_16270 [Pseudomonas sp. R76]
MEKVEAIRQLVNVGRARDVLAFVEGDSSYVTSESVGAPQELEYRRLWILVVHHLRFVSKYGAHSSGIMKDGKYLTAFPQEFDRWLQIGAPGVSSGDLDMYLKDFPL